MFRSKQALVISFEKKGVLGDVWLEHSGTTDHANTSIPQNNGYAASFNTVFEAHTETPDLGCENELTDLGSRLDNACFPHSKLCNVIPHNPLQALLMRVCIGAAVRGNNRSGNQRQIHDLQILMLRWIGKVEDPFQGNDRPGPMPKSLTFSGNVGWTRC
jgi:hypothetical protein